MRILEAVLVGVLLTACGGSSEPPKIQDVADSIGCQGFKADEGQTYTREGGSCTVSGQDVYLYTFSDTGKRDQWLAAAAAGGGVFVRGDLWAAQTFDAGVADKVAKAGGGALAN